MSFDAAAVAPGMPTQVPMPADRARVRAVLFDLDGTLYSQQRLRALMVPELLALPVRRPHRGWKELQAIAAYRRAQERLRGAWQGGDLASAQIEAAAAAAGLTPDEVERVVNEWMLERPLKYLRWCRAPGILEILSRLDDAGVMAGVLSDYPAEGKLRALGLSGRFSIVLCSSDPEIAAFKPSPRGFTRACELWGLTPDEVLAVGDRADVDAAGAAAAGMSCVIVGRSRGVVPPGVSCVTVPSLERLTCVLDDCR